MIEKMVETDIAIVGAGGCGLTAALVATEQGKRVLLLERNSAVGGSTAMSAGIFVAAGSRLQRENGETGTPEELAADILRLNGRQSDASLTKTLCFASGPLMDWLVDQGVPLEHMPDYKYPGMSRSWIHSPPQRDGLVMTNVLLRAVKRQPAIDLHLQTRVAGLTSTAEMVTGLTATRPDGESISVRAQSVILAASGFGANPSMVAHYIPEFAGAQYYGAQYATGDAIQWGQSMGAATDHMGAYQSHSSIAYPKKMLVTTYLINHGAIQVNQHGRRFGDETDSYAGHALAVQAQPNHVVVELFDEYILNETLENYPRFTECLSAGIVERSETLAELAQKFNLDGDNLARTVSSYNTAVLTGKDDFGRSRFGEPLSSPFYGISVTSALVQTLGGLRVDARARVKRLDETPIPGLYAGGGSASGMAGERPQGYLAGTGLLSAFGLGWIAGHDAAR
ncbi:MAG: FAD-dependent oxidoreductase [Chloroflexi bacterium]|jgi:fumarate reductase flavoprotein subunit|nr:FAD-dependent oxidoreductase [Chloroflexota bacterium]